MLLLYASLKKQKNTRTNSTIQNLNGASEMGTFDRREKHEKSEELSTK